MAATLSLLLLGLCLRLFWPGFRFVLIGGARAELQQRAVLTTQRLAEDLQSTGACGVSLSANTLAVQPISEITPDPRVVYATSLIGWLWRGERLQRLVWPASPVPLDPDLPLRLDATGLAGLDAVASSGQRTLTLDGARDFSVTSSAADGNIESPLTLRLSLRRLVGHTPEDFTLERAVVLRNGF